MDLPVALKLTGSLCFERVGSFCSFSLPDKPRFAEEGVRLLKVEGGPEKAEYRVRGRGRHSAGVACLAFPVTALSSTTT